MCGIVGSLQWDSFEHEHVIRHMASKLAHRGPDAENVVTLNPIVLGHRRLSIIDVSSNANQPMRDNTGRYWIVYNGELYNFKEVKANLIKLGHHFITESDTEVVLASFKQYGIDCLQTFEGMFAFALWDKEEKSLFMARDRMGEKPLYYATTPARASKDTNLIFASELPALCVHPNIAFNIDPKALSQFLSLNYILTDTCILKGIQKLPPAHYLILKKEQKPMIRCYWHYDEILKNANQNAYALSSKKEAIQHLNDLLQHTVKNQMISDVPLGAFLSGGIDSSSIVSSMKPFCDNIQTFSIGFHEATYSEIEESKQVAQHLNVQHHTQFMDDNITAILPKIIQSTGEPFADSSMIPTYFLAEFSRQQVKVCLSGDGGDELFLGYETYVADKLHRYMQFLPKTWVLMAKTFVNHTFPVSHAKISLDYKLKQFLQGCQWDFQRAHYFWRLIFTNQEKEALLNEDCRATVMQYDPFESFAKYFNEVAECDPLIQATYVDIKTWLVDDILVKVDRLSMAHSLEVRAPFLSHPFVEFAAKLPLHWKMKGFQKKHILKEAQRNRLPHSILHRAKKGFNAPISPWLTTKLQSFMQEVLLDNKTIMSEWFNCSYLEKLWQEHKLQKKDHGLKLFGLMCFYFWHEHCQHIFKQRIEVTKNDARGILI